MSATTLSVILDRAKSATLRSPLALFTMPGGRVDCIFASTVTGQRRIKRGIGLIATVTRTDCPEFIRDTVRRASYV